MIVEKWKKWSISDVDITITIKPTSLIICIRIIIHMISLIVCVLKNDIPSFFFCFFIIYTIIILSKSLYSSLIVYSSIRIKIISFEFMGEHVVHHFIFWEHFIAFLTFQLSISTIGTTFFYESVAAFLVFSILLESLFVLISRW